MWAVPQSTLGYQRTTLFIRIYSMVERYHTWIMDVRFMMMLIKYCWIILKRKRITKTPRLYCTAHFFASSYAETILEVLSKRKKGLDQQNYEKAKLRRPSSGCYLYSYIIWILVFGVHTSLAHHILRSTFNGFNFWTHINCREKWDNK